ncbi:uncharacterized protein [Rhodnius prolixus]|uniref:uncharacterized protein n=1 Tax=Rhodnius prolixus TaxID=13249 RepID=UPI003D18BAD2
MFPNVIASHNLVCIAVLCLYTTMVWFRLISIPDISYLWLSKEVNVSSRQAEMTTWPALTFQGEQDDEDDRLLGEMLKVAGVPFIGSNQLSWFLADHQPISYGSNMTYLLLNKTTNTFEQVNFL